MKFFQRLVISLFLLSLTACQSSLVEFQPASGSLFKITFFYPENWVWEEQRPFNVIVPGEEPPPSELIVSQDGIISIRVYKPSNPQAQMQERMEAFSGAIASMPHTDTIIQIDGHDARWFTVVHPPPSPTSESYTQEAIYLIAEDRFYSIGFTCFESEENRRLRKEFKELIKTIKILQ